MTDSASTPRWADSSQCLGRWIERLIGIAVLRRPLSFQARQPIIRTAELNGIPWRVRRRELQKAAAPLLSSIINPRLKPPDYYLARFHAYEQGNLCWEAAAEAEQATDAMALRIWPEECFVPSVGQARLRDEIHRAVAPVLKGSIDRILDLGCSVGVSALYLARWPCERADWLVACSRG